MNFVLLSQFIGLNIKLLTRYWAIFFSSWALKTLGFVLGARNFSKEQWRGWVCGLYQKCWWFTLRGSGRSVVVILHSLLYLLECLSRKCQPRFSAYQSGLIFCFCEWKINDIVVSVLDSGLSHLDSLWPWEGQMLNSCASHFTLKMPPHSGLCCLKAG